MNGQPDDEDVDWLKQLQHSIWDKREDNSFGQRRTWSVEKRSMTDAEVAHLSYIAGRPGFFYSIGSGVFGFGYVLQIWMDSTYPGIPPEALVSVTDKHLPTIESDRSLQKQKAWELFSLFAINPDNVSKLRYYGMDEPKSDPSYYDY